MSVAVEVTKPKQPVEKVTKVEFFGITVNQLLKLSRVRDRKWE